MRFRAYNAQGDVIESGSAPKGSAEFHADEKVSRVVFYSGTKASEAVAGEVKLSTPKSGKIEARLDVG